MLECDKAFTNSEFEEALVGVKNGKVAGENGIPPGAIKALTGNKRQPILHWCKTFWNGEMDYKSWYWGLLVVVPKSGEKDKTDLNKYCGVNLMDVVSEVMSRILNKRLFKILKKHRRTYQFEGTPDMGCRNGTLTLETLLHTRRNNNLPSHVIYIDLMKAYNTGNHELLLRVHEKYGAPPKTGGRHKQALCQPESCAEAR